MIKLFQDLKSITFISSESCNLNCEYCEISKNARISHSEEVKKVKESLQSGAYLAKYKQFFKRFNIDKSKIGAIELWGQEPTLTLDEFSSQIEEIFRWLPNIHQMFFSTNGVAYTDKIINLVNTINNGLDLLNPDQNFILQVQFSFDGFGHTESKRGTKNDLIINNLKYFIKELNKIQLKENFKVNILCHGVLTFDTINQGFEEGIEKFWNEIDQTMKSIHFLSTNRQVVVNRRFTMGIQQPYNATKEEGQLLAKYLNYCYNTPFMDLEFDMLHPMEIIGLYHNPINNFLKENHFNNLVKVANYDYNDDSDDITYLYQSVGCNAGKSNIKMRYNGQFIYCQNIIFNVNEKDFDDTKIGAEYDIQRYQLKKNNFPNLLTDSIEDIEKAINILDGESHTSFAFQESLLSSLLLLLSKYDQVDESYKNNYEKILKHASYLTRIIYCWYNHLIETGSFYVKSLGFIRYFCNGLLDLIEQKGYIEDMKYEN